MGDSSRQGFKFSEISIDGRYLLELEELSFWFNKRKRSKTQVESVGEFFPRSKLCRGKHPVIPMENCSGHVECGNSQLLFRWGLMENEEALNLKEPA